MAFLKKINKILKPADFFNNLSTKPLSRKFGFDRGTPVDRYYIEKFLEKNKSIIKGKVIEVAEDTYSKKFSTGVTSFEILHIDKNNKSATIIGDLTKSDELPNAEADCFICTQTLNFIYEPAKAVKGIYRLLKSGGIALVTIAGLTQISHYDMERWGDYWRFTNLSAQKIFADVFGIANVKVETFGNVFSSVALLEGISAEELPEEKLDVYDKDYQIIISVVAEKK